MGPIFLISFNYLRRAKMSLAYLEKPKYIVDLVKPIYISDSLLLKSGKVYNIVSICGKLLLA